MLFKRYSLPSFVLHWGVASLFIFVYYIGDTMVDLPPSDEKWSLIANHKSLGVVLFALAIFRVLWRANEGFPLPKREETSMSIATARVVHISLLVVTLLMPISGILMSVGSGRGVKLFDTTLIYGGEKIAWMQQVGSLGHQLLSYFILLLLAAHILGAAKSKLSLRRV
ncbi:hypothetical protein TW78_16835 [Vibrio coralliilyticus]|uniref:Cytochrome b561 bacterial/Ni-hydrogenase domain-containing protein n=1 Tax=Vibrio coralliilyticus TaxID=190893 RepID=A0A837G4E2_9VIBR|nr:cytochrome b/b6 domain-containing protein [Vibrio coralliilyticus]KJY69916.1 hypothetical protein TW78_16835 [Vibrio coralliilyticus]QOU32337.1 cytochrome b [Vibrio coralliilyticus]